MSRPSARHIAALHAKLLTWYDGAHRKLPWRDSPGRVGHPDPYHVLVSEAMLQQTQVATVIAYFERFIAAFPDVATLSAAGEAEVLRQWQGLGYYRRARNLHAAAKAIVAEHGREVPRDLADLRALPGVGAYTAGAIASIAYGLPAAAVDGNVARVLARLFAIDEVVDQPAGRRCVTQLAEALVPDSAPGDFNQAMMELGATICTPRQPKCDACPVASLCEAYKTNSVAKYPQLTARRKPQAVVHRIFAVIKNDRVLLQQRPATGLWANMWQLPTQETDDAAPVAQWIAAQFGLSITLPQKLGSFTHQTTHRTITFNIARCDWQAGNLRRGSGIWRHITKVDDLAMSNAQRRALALLAASP